MGKPKTPRRFKLTLSKASLIVFASMLPTHGAEEPDGGCVGDLIPEPLPFQGRCVNCGEVVGIESVEGRAFLELWQQARWRLDIPGEPRKLYARLEELRKWIEKQPRSRQLHLGVRRG